MAESSDKTWSTGEGNGKPLQYSCLENPMNSMKRQKHRTHSVCLQCRRPGFDPWVGKIPWRRKWQPTPVFLPGESHGQRSLVVYSPRGSKESDTTERLHFHFSLSCIGGGSGNPLQGSFLENPRDFEAWWAAVYGVAQSRTRLKRLSSSMDLTNIPDAYAILLFIASDLPSITSLIHNWVLFLLSLRSSFFLELFLH